MSAVLRRMDWNRAAGLLAVVALHGGVLYGLWSAQLIPPPSEAVTLFVNFINPPPPQPAPRATPVLVPSKSVKPLKPAKPAEPPKIVEPPKVVEPPKMDEPAMPLVKPTHYHLAAEAPVISRSEVVEPLPPSAPVAAPPPPAPAAPMPVGPVTLASELAVVCPDRTPPAYPLMARRLGETGTVVLRVELDETGRVSAAQILNSSGFSRLDAAALAAVKTWRCLPAQHGGEAVRAVATQPFNFTLEGR